MLHNLATIRIIGDMDDKEGMQPSRETLSTAAEASDGHEVACGAHAGTRGDISGRNCVELDTHPGMKDEGGSDRDISQGGELHAPIADMQAISEQSLCANTQPVTHEANGSKWRTPRNIADTNYSGLAQSTHTDAGIEHVPLLISPQR